MGRPKSTDERRRANFPVRLSPLERALLAAAADQVGETLTSFMRRAAIDRAIRLTTTEQDDGTQTQTETTRADPGD
jgi:uncharacterized protein (DUF1778 family)